MATKKVSNCVMVNVSEPVSKQEGIQMHLVESERLIREDILPKLQGIYSLLFNESLPSHDVKEPECVTDSCVNIHQFMNHIINILDDCSRKIQ